MSRPASVYRTVNSNHSSTYLNNNKEEDSLDSLMYQYNEIPARAQNGRNISQQQYMEEQYNTFVDTNKQDALSQYMSSRGNSRSKNWDEFSASGLEHNQSISIRTAAQQQYYSQVQQQQQQQQQQYAYSRQTESRGSSSSNEQYYYNSRRTPSSSGASNLAEFNEMVAKNSLSSRSRPKVINSRLPWDTEPQQGRSSGPPSDSPEEFSPGPTHITNSVRRRNSNTSDINQRYLHSSFSDSNIPMFLEDSIDLQNGSNNFAKQGNHSSQYSQQQQRANNYGGVSQQITPSYEHAESSDLRKQQRPLPASSATSSSAKVQAYAMKRRLDIEKAQKLRELRKQNGGVLPDEVNEEVNTPQRVPPRNQPSVASTRTNDGVDRDSDQQVARQQPARSLSNGRHQSASTPMMKQKQQQSTEEDYSPSQAVTPLSLLKQKIRIGSAARSTDAAAPTAAPAKAEKRSSRVMTMDEEAEDSYRTQTRILQQRQQPDDDDQREERSIRASPEQLAQLKAKNVTKPAGQQPTQHSARGPTSTARNTSSNTYDEVDEYQASSQKRQTPISRTNNRPTATASEAPATSSNSNNFQGIFTDPPPEAEGELGDLVPCPTCGRKFKEDRIEKHVSICQKNANKQRKVFDTRAQRLDAEALKLAAEAEKANPKTEEKTEKKSKWKIQRAQFRAAIHAGNPNRSSVAVAAEAPVEDDRVECPHCGRRFAQESAERHIPKCKNVQAKPSTLMRGSGVAGGVKSTTTTTKAAPAFKAQTGVRASMMAPAPQQSLASKLTSTTTINRCPTQVAVTKNTSSIPKANPASAGRVRRN